MTEREIETEIALVVWPFETTLAMLVDVPLVISVTFPVREIPKLEPLPTPTAAPGPAFANP